MGIELATSIITCPHCSEQKPYLPDRGGILPGEYFYEGFFDTHYGTVYDCYTCGHSWKVRKSRKSLLVKLFPFLEYK